MPIEYIPFRRDREGKGIWGSICWMRTREVDCELPPRHKGDRCIFCKGPLACAPLPHPTLPGYGITRCDACDVWMNYEI